MCCWEDAHYDGDAPAVEEAVAFADAHCCCVFVDVGQGDEACVKLAYQPGVHEVYSMLLTHVCKRISETDAVEPSQPIRQMILGLLLVEVGEIVFI